MLIFLRGRIPRSKVIRDMRRKSTFGYFAIAGVIGSFRVVSENGWLMLIPFWLIVFAGSKAIDWCIEKWDL